MLRFIALLALIAATGCSSNPPVAPATGKVSRNGSLAVSGRVLFLPIGGGKQAIGAVEPDGSFTLTTFDADDGALIGQHKPVLIKVAFADRPDDDATFQANDDQPCTVVANQANEFAFDLGNPSWKRLEE